MERITTQISRRNILTHSLFSFMGTIYRGIGFTWLDRDERAHIRRYGMTHPTWRKGNRRWICADAILRAGYVGHGEIHSTPFTMAIARVVAVFIIMLSAAARAFSTHTASTRRPFFGLVARTMSTTDDNTVVATCTRKIQEALATTDVKVTGALLRKSSQPCVSVSRDWLFVETIRRTILFMHVSCHRIMLSWLT